MISPIFFVVTLMTGAGTMDAWMTKERLCKLMPLDNDMYDVKMPSLEGKDWAGANGDWVVYIGSNCESELVNVFTHHRGPLP